VTRTVPVIDLMPYVDGSDPQSVVDQVDQACRTIGFLVIRGHGVPADLQRRTLSTGREFFAKPISEKREFSMAAPGRGGYQEFANMSLAQSYDLDTKAPVDLREGFSFNRTHIADEHSSIWGGAQADPAMGTTFAEYFSTLNGLADTLLEIFALALGRKSNYFVPLNNRNQSSFALYHYPPMTRPPQPGQLRGGAHTDFGSLTILFGEPSVRGLQVSDGERWSEAPIEEDTFVVNIGDLLMRWTNDKYKSTLHRVANPPEGDWDTSRYTFVFFHTPNDDALISSLDQETDARYPDITAGEYFRTRMSAMSEDRKPGQDESVVAAPSVDVNRR
jgi:isopenicillin N synthase-like dioxygenase